MTHPAYWYGKALQKVATFLPDLDEDLIVEVCLVSVTQTPGKPYAEHRTTLALCFSHKTNPDIRWTMDIGENDEYIEHQLPNVVKSILIEKRGW